MRCAAPNPAQARRRARAAARRARRRGSATLERSFGTVPMLVADDFIPAYTRMFPLSSYAERASQACAARDATRACPQRSDFARTRHVSYRLSCARCLATCPRRSDAGARCARQWALCGPVSSTASAPTSARRASRRATRCTWVSSSYGTGMRRATLTPPRQLTWVAVPRTPRAVVDSSIEPSSRARAGMAGMRVQGSTVGRYAALTALRCAREVSSTGYAAALASPSLRAIYSYIVCAYSVYILMISGVARCHNRLV